MSDVDAILAERQKTHGDFKDHANITQRLKAAMRGADGWAKLSDMQKESLEMVQHKVGRALSGDPDAKDHWDDIAGYATLVAKRLKNQDH